MYSIFIFTSELVCHIWNIVSSSELPTSQHKRDVELLDKVQQKTSNISKGLQHLL